MKRNLFLLLLYKVVLLLLLLLLLSEVEAQSVYVTNNMVPGKRNVDLEKVMKETTEIGMKYREKNLNAPLPPVVLIPGVGGSQLFANINKSSDDHWFCHKQVPWFRIWLTLDELIPGSVDCFVEHVSLIYNNTLKKSFNNSGVDVISPSFGSTESIEILDPTWPSETMYFAAVVNSLVSAGYNRKVNLFGAPYDWRISPGNNPYFFSSLRTLIENAFYSNGQTPVVIVAHSMGTLFSHVFFASMTQAWKDKFIKSWIPISPPWLGAAQAIRGLVSGDDFSIPILDLNSAKTMERTFEASYFLLPYANYWTDFPFVLTQKQNYTARNFTALFHDVPINYGNDIYQMVSKQFNPLLPPYVKTYCLYGHNLPTVIQFTFQNGDFNAQPKINYDDGDGTVPLQSLTWCTSWLGKQNQTLLVKGFANMEHVDILQNRDFNAALLAYILE